MLLAPNVTSLEINKLSSTDVGIKWDDIGSNFYYVINIKETRNDVDWLDLGYTTNNKLFYTELNPNTFYKARVASIAPGFEQSSWIETEEFQTFDQNAYSFDTMTELTLSNKLIHDKFINNNNSFMDFSVDGMRAALMSEDFQYSPSFEYKSSVENYILYEDEYHEIQGDISKVCRDKDRVMLMESDGILYLFERFQNIVKVSNDKGQSWKSIKLLVDRVGNPVSRTVHYQTGTTTYILGYEKIFNGRKSSDVRWSADDVTFSSDDVTFAKLGDTTNLGFEVEIYGTYATLPADISRISEAICANDKNIYVAARGKVRYAKSKNAPVDTDPLSPTFGEKIFEKEVLTIVANNKAVCSKLDTVHGNVYALITGEVKQFKQDPTNPNNVIDSKDKGVYLLQGNKFIRVFGNTQEERDRIEHGYTMMSADEDSVFFSSSNYRLLQSDIVEDKELPLNNENVSSAVKGSYTVQYEHDKHYIMMAYRATNTNWKLFKPERMKYYAEPFFSLNFKSNTRSWINNSDRVVVVYSNIIHDKTVDKYSSASTQRVLKEVWKEGTCTVISPNVEFNSFNRYASGILFYKASGDNEIIGYYEFEYRVLDDVKIVWKPESIFLRAYLQDQERYEPFIPKVKDVNDPDLRPLIQTMMPDSYLLQNSNFEKFCEYYLQFISDGTGTQYNNLLNLIKNKYPREEDSWEYMWSEIYKRNIYLDRDKRDLVSRFFETRKLDFYSTKGIEASYKFLFKVLYNEEVDIEIESNSGLEYDITVESNNISEDLVGRTIYTKTGRSNVTYIERYYNKGKLQWKITIHNMIGRYVEGQEIKSENSRFEGMITKGVSGKELLSNNIEYINRNRSYYVMKIKSVLPTSRYKDDVIRFVHPAGFGFIGITLLTMFINAGISMKHVETIVHKLKNYKWDAGLPSVWHDRVAVLDSNDNITYDIVTGEAVYVDHPKKGESFPLPSNYNSENKNSMIGKLNPDQRRKSMSPLFDQSAVSFSRHRNILELMLKDNINNPRDPVPPTQIKVDE